MKLTKELIRLFKYHGFMTMTAPVEDFLEKFNTVEELSAAGFLTGHDAVEFARNICSEDGEPACGPVVDEDVVGVTEESEVEPAPETTETEVEPAPETTETEVEPAPETTEESEKVETEVESAPEAAESEKVETEVEPAPEKETTPKKRTTKKTSTK